MWKRAGSGECRRHDARITIHRLLLIGAIALCKFQHGGASEAPSTAPSAASSNISGDVPSNVPEISSYRPSDVATSSQIPTIDSSTLPSQLSSSLVSDAPTLSESLDTSQEPTITSTEMSRDEASWSLIPTLDAIVASSDSPTHQPSLDLSEAPSLLQTGQMSEEPTFETTNLSSSLVPSLEQGWTLLQCRLNLLLSIQARFRRYHQQRIPQNFPQLYPVICHHKIQQLMYLKSQQ